PAPTDTSTLSLHDALPICRIDDPFEKLVPGYDLNRDPERSPMRWDGSRNGGFTLGEPWLPLGPDVAQRNVAKLKDDSRSIAALRSEEHTSELQSQSNLVCR